MFLLLHKPKFLVSCEADDPFKASSKTFTDPLKAKKGRAGARARVQAGYVTTSQPLEACTDGKERNLLCRIESVFLGKMNGDIHMQTIYDFHHLTFGKVLKKLYCCKC